MGGRRHETLRRRDVRRQAFGTLHLCEKPFGLVVEAKGGLAKRSYRLLVQHQERRSVGWPLFVQCRTVLLPHVFVRILGTVAENGAGHDVALLQLVHEALAQGIQQDGAGAAERFRREELNGGFRCLGVDKRGRVHLDLIHVNQQRPRLGRRLDALALGPRPVGGGQAHHVRYVLLQKARRVGRVPAGRDDNGVRADVRFSAAVLGALHSNANDRTVGRGEKIGHAQANPQCDLLSGDELVNLLAKSRDNIPADRSGLPIRL